MHKQVDIQSDSNRREGRNSVWFPVKIFLIFFLLSPLPSLLAQETGFDSIPPLTIPKGELPRVSVLEIQNSTGIEPSPDNNLSSMPRDIATLLTTALFKTKCFKVVESSHEIMEEVINPEKADFFVVGEITQFGIRKTSVFIPIGGSKRYTTRIGIDIRMVDAENGIIVKALHTIGECASDQVLVTGEQAKIPIWIASGTEGWDETCLGKAALRAINKAAYELAKHYIEFSKKGGKKDE